MQTLVVERSIFFNRTSVSPKIDPLPLTVSGKLKALESSFTKIDISTYSEISNKSIIEPRAQKKMSWTESPWLYMTSSLYKIYYYNCGTT